MKLHLKFLTFFCVVWLFPAITFSAKPVREAGGSLIDEAIESGIDLDDFLDNLGDPDFRPSIPSRRSQPSDRNARDIHLGDGFLITTIGTGDEAARAVVIQTDGKILSAGRLDNGSNNDFVVVRYHADGELDTSFNTRGKMTASFGGGTDVAHGIAYDTSGRAIVVGSTDSGTPNALDFAVMRLNVDGTLDTTFNSSGKVATSIHTGAEFARAVTVQSNGTILAAGYTRSGHYNVAVVRYRTDGVLDTTFNTNGKVSISIGTIDSAANAIKIQTDGNIVLGGTTWNGTDWDFVLLRLKTDGTLDTSFNTNGTKSAAILSGDDVGFALGIATDGKLILGGTAHNGSNFKFGLARFSTDGVLDTSFNTAGKVTVAIGTGNERLFGLGMQVDGGILGAGVSSNGTNNDFVVARYRSDGILDTSFNTAGFLRHSLGTGEDVAQAIAMVGDQTIYVAGRMHNGTNLDFGVTRYHTDGTSAKSGQLDKGLRTGGMVANSVGTAADLFYAAKQQTDGRLLASGLISVAGTTNVGFAVVRFNHDGTLDTSFRTSGLAVNTIGAQATGHTGYGLIIQTDGKAVATGVTSTAPTKFALIRYNTDGTLDTSFLLAGIVTGSMGTSANDSGARAIVLETGGKLIIGGFAGNGTDMDFAVSRYNTDGTLDTSFYTGGKQAHTIGTGGEEIFGLVLQSDGRLVAVGFSRDSAGTNDALAVARYTTDGQLDTTFYTSGFRVEPTVGASDATYYGVAMDGLQIIAVGYGDSKLAIARYHSSGTLDTSFETKGIVYKVNSTTTIGRGVQVQTNRKYVAAGYDGSTQEFIVMRYTSGGILDTSFNSSGLKVASINGNANYGYGVILQNDGKIVVPGGYTNGTTDYAIMRFWP